MTNLKNLFKGFVFPFHGIDHFISYVLSMFFYEKHKRFINIVAEYSEAISILNHLVKRDFELANIEINEADVTGYNDAYIITIENYKLWCEPVLNSNGYLISDGITFVHENVNKKYIESNSDEECILFRVDA